MNTIEVIRGDLVCFNYKGGSDSERNGDAVKATIFILSYIDCKGYV